MRSLRARTEQIPELTVLAPALIAMLVVTAVVVILPLRLGFNSLERLKE
jgi:hypothetical protein